MQACFYKDMGKEVQVVQSHTTRLNLIIMQGLISRQLLGDEPSYGRRGRTLHACCTTLIISARSTDWPADANPGAYPSRGESGKGAGATLR
eukprot:605409-Pleurochrysis_carterae.AAC.2